MNEDGFSHFADAQSHQPHLLEVGAALRGLTKPQAVAFGLSCAERAFAVYRIAAKYERDLAPSLGRELLKEYWNEISSVGTFVAPRFDVDSPIVLELYPESFLGSPLAPAGDSFPNSILSVSLFLQTGELEHVVNCAKLGLLRVYYYVELVTSETKDSRDEQDGIVTARTVQSTYLWKREIDTQIEDLRNVRVLGLKEFRALCERRGAPSTLLLKLLSDGSA